MPEPTATTRNTAARMSQLSAIASGYWVLGCSGQVTVRSAPRMGQTQQHAVQSEGIDEAACGAPRTSGQALRVAHAIHTVNLKPLHVTGHHAGYRAPVGRFSSIRLHKPSTL